MSAEVQVIFSVPAIEDDFRRRFGCLLDNQFSREDNPRPVAVNGRSCIFKCFKGCIQTGFIGDADGFQNRQRSVVNGFDLLR